MKILKLLNKRKIFFLFFFYFIFNNAFSNETVDIWNIEKKGEDTKQILENLSNEDEQISIIDNLNKNSAISITEETDLELRNKYLIGLYDPDENDLSINMWEFSDGEKISKIIKKINKLNLSRDAKEIYNKVILTNAFPPKKNSKNKFI